MGEKLHYNFNPFITTLLFRKPVIVKDPIQSAMPFYVECSRCKTRMELISFLKVSSSHRLLKREYWMGRFICPNCHFIDAYPIGLTQGNRMFKTKQCYTLWYFWIMRGRRERNRRLISNTSSLFRTLSKD